MIREWRGRYVGTNIEWTEVEVLDPAVWYLSRYEEPAPECGSAPRRAEGAAIGE